jgi:hypothetical protein
MEEMTRPSSWSEAARHTPSISDRSVPASARAAAAASKTSSSRLSAAGSATRTTAAPAT